MKNSLFSSIFGLNGETGVPKMENPPPPPQKRKISQEKIEELLNKFCFEKVHECMIKYDHFWGFNGDEERVPTIEEMKQRLRTTIGNRDLGGGGFEIEYNYYEHGDVVLKFILTSETISNANLKTQTRQKTLQT